MDVWIGIGSDIGIGSADVVAVVVVIVVVTLAVERIVSFLIAEVLDTLIVHDLFFRTTFCGSVVEKDNGY